MPHILGGLSGLYISILCIIIIFYHGDIVVACSIVTLAFGTITTSLLNLGQSSANGEAIKKTHDAIVGDTNETTEL